MMNTATRVLTAAAVGALWVGTMALTAPQPELVQGTPHAAAVSVDIAQEDTSDTACWVEKVHSIETAEVICGARGLRPATDTVDIGEVFGPGCGWVAVKAEVPTATAVDQALSLEPAGCN